mgnify:CR=1 FL=1
MTFDRAFISSLTFKPFDSNLWAGFSGCQSAVPFYAETDELLFIIDGARVTAYDENCELIFDADITEV